MENFTKKENGQGAPDQKNVQNFQELPFCSVRKKREGTARIIKKTCYRDGRGSSSHRIPRSTKKDIAKPEFQGGESLIFRWLYGEKKSSNRGKKPANGQIGNRGG